MSTKKIHWKQKLEAAVEFKSNGNTSFKQKDLKNAMRQYHKSLLYLKGIECVRMGHPMTGNEVAEQDKVPESEVPTITKLMVDCYNNLAACLLQKDDTDYEKVISYCNSVLENDTSNTKALYRKGVALYHLKRPDEGLECLRATALLPGTDNDRLIKQYTTLCERACVEQDGKLKHTYQAMFTSDQANVDEISTSINGGNND